jgi:peptidoglycan/xylan/chitin deacetylase (PgdA/CDA1 family)
MKSRVLFFILICLLIEGCTPSNNPEPSEEGKIIVLMYHRIVQGEPVNLYERNVADFEADLNYLIDNQINVISFSNLENYLSSGKMPFGNSAVLTFDDGDHSWYTLVKPLLLQYKMKATFFLWTDMIGHDSFLSWNEIEDMSYYTLPGGEERPFVFGSHSFSHQYLLQRKNEFATAEEYNSFLDYELGVSKEKIGEHTPGEVSILSLPYGDGAGDQEIISAAKRNGYKFIRTSIWGAIENTETSLFIIPSLPILDKTNADLIGNYLGL